jgi:hypothetical protein
MTAYGPEGEPGVTRLDGAEVGGMDVEVGGGSVGEAASAGWEVGEGCSEAGGRDVKAGSAVSVAAASGVTVNENPQPSETNMSVTSKGMRVDFLADILHLTECEYNAVHTVTLGQGIVLP